MSTAPDAPLPDLARHDGVLVWSVPAGWSAISSAAVGGGILRPRWVLNAGVDEGFARTDLEVWAAQTAGGLGLAGPGCALLTAADVSQVEHARRDGVLAWATVGVTKPTWPHDPLAGGPRPDGHLAGPRGTALEASARQVPAPGTVNIVVAVPVPLTPSALVQALGTVTEAKAQVLVGAGVPGTGTASDAVVVLCPDRDAVPGAPQVPFVGVRSTWGRRVAHAVHDAVLTGLAAHPWTPAADEERVW